MWIVLQIFHTWNPWAVLIAIGSLILIILLRRLFPKWPAAIIAIYFATAITQYWELPIESIRSKFGEIPRTLPSPLFPHFLMNLLLKFSLMPFR